MCRIGQADRCVITGCEWRKLFHSYCWKENKLESVKGARLKGEIKVNFFSKKRGRIVKEEKKYTEVKNIVPKVKNLKEEENFVNKISTASQDDWIKKIKTI